MKPTDISSPDYHHKVVDCQYACPAHTPVPEYIRLIHQQRYGDAYMVNWESNVFPGVLGRVCDRPCETACRRGRIDEEPVAICRLKRVAADMTEQQQILSQLPAIPELKNGKTVALVGAGPASLTVARDLMPLGYSIHLYDEQLKAGGMMRSQIPSFRLPMSVLDDELGYILDMGVDTFFGNKVDSLKGLLDKNYDAIVVGTGAPRGRDLAKLDGRKEGDDNIHIGIEWLSSIAFDHTDSVGKRVLVLGGGNTAMDCCRSARRLGGEDVKIVVRSPYADMKASPWEKEDAMHEDIPIFDNHSPKEFVCDNGKLVGMNFEKVDAVYDENGKRSLIPTGEIVYFECDDVIIAVGQENVFPWIEKDVGIEFGQWDMPVVDKVTYQSTLDKVFFAGDAAFGPENIITAVAQAHQAAISIDLMLAGKDLHRERPDPTVNLVSQKMGVHEWSYSSSVANDSRYVVPIEDKEKSLANRFVEVELGYSLEDAVQETQRCLNCDVQTVFYGDRCIECDSCMDVCPTDCISFVELTEEADLRQRLSAPATNLAQDLYISDVLPTKRAMVKDEDVCLHCGLCAERCPTTAWDMQKFLFKDSKAGGSCR
ncbi:NADPH-Fe(3+) oxidoreductase subunit beta [Sinobacterium norvegicum]|uniref:NADPH-Fe(3+) oxidoreductase subunit beta n=1 Tax=Sinobacterium norvegicum TaxID=1641715 RepID=A0ABM9AEE0_9GAMM|nr:FAD-dependent oxidoreductase [Sinobacterium norvegicum]CAH0991574.1 NADPH-Fe(3+) oxidoreductase subunit beta [Sinobacterium norvegicum]